MAFPGGRLVEIFLDDEAGRAVLSTAVGTPHTARVSHLHKLLLQYNLLWRETSGVRMAIDEPEGEVVMLYDLILAGLDSLLLQNILGNFAAAAGAWQTMVEAPPTEESDDPEQLPAKVFFHSEYLRV
jgi:hypothetical protein